MEILLWLVPPVVVTVVAMLWVSWVGRDRREVDREEAVRRLGAALEKEQPARPVRTPRRRERSTGVALRRTPRTARGVPAPTEPGAEQPAAQRSSQQTPSHEQRRAS